MLLTWDYYRSLFYSFVIAFILVNIVYLVTIRLDKKIDWKQHTIQRVGLQILAGIIFPAFLAFILAYFYFRSFGLNIFVNTYYLRFDFPVVVLMLMLFNIYYLAFYFYRKWQLLEQEKDHKPLFKDDAATTFIVQRGTKNIPITVGDICYFYHNENYNFLRTFEKEDFLIAESLEEVEQQLPPTFFRANRQIIVSIKACDHFQSLEFNKLELFTQPPFKQPIVISQKKTRSFKEWMKRKNTNPF